MALGADIQTDRQTDRQTHKYTYRRANKKDFKKPAMRGLWPCAPGIKRGIGVESEKYTNKF